MEEMDCESPSVSSPSPAEDSKTEVDEGEPPAKKPRPINGNALTENTNKSPVRVSRFLKRKAEHDLEDENFKDDIEARLQEEKNGSRFSAMRQNDKDEENDDKENEKLEVSITNKNAAKPPRVSRFLTMRDNDEELENMFHEKIDIEEAGPSYKNDNIQVSFARPLSGASDSESDDEYPLQVLRKENTEKNERIEENITNETNSSSDEAESSHINENLRKSPVGPLLGASDTDSDDDNPLQVLRRENKKKIMAIVNKYRNLELERQFASSKPKAKPANLESARQGKRKRGDGDATYKFSGSLPLQLRKSSRLQKKKPQYNFDTLDDIQETGKRTYFKRPNYKIEDGFEDLEEVVYRPKRKSIGRKKVEDRVIIPVEDVTPKMLSNIALRVKGKVYSPNGTTCHQCRQKTLDQKTCCRGPNCSGALGMFCGVCIKNRYGEDAADALLDPNWICPVCRGKCNCSICRTKEGKRPTGVLAPFAQQSGYESVDHFLDTLKGEGDRPEEDNKWKLERDPEAVLGFSDEGRKIHFRDGTHDFMVCSSCTYKDCNNPKNLLGFSKDGNCAIMGGKKEETLFGPKSRFFAALDLVHV